MFMRLLISHRVLIGEWRYNKNWSFKGVLIRYGVLASLFTELNGSNHVYFRNLLLCCLSWVMMMLVKKQKLRVRVIHGFYNSFILECHRYHTPHLEITLFKMRVCAGGVILFRGRLVELITFSSLANVFANQTFKQISKIASKKQIWTSIRFHMARFQFWLDTVKSLL